MEKIEGLLTKVENIVYSGIDKQEVIKILEIIKCHFPYEILDEIKLYGDYLPKNREVGFSDEKRYLHFLWDALDKSPMCLIANFSIYYRQILGKKLFRSCGENFIAEENVRFNVPGNIIIGNNVFINRGTYIDSKGGVIIGDSVGIGENVTIFTHSHAEHDHSVRTYERVIIEEYSKIYANATILGGVKIKKQGIVGACSLVNKDVSKNTLVVGIPAKKLRDRKNLDKSGKELSLIFS